jgi:hypothetical protein
MERYFIILSLISLVAAGCQSGQPAIDSQKNLPAVTSPEGTDAPQKVESQPAQASPKTSIPSSTASPSKDFDDPGPINTWHKNDAVIRGHELILFYPKYWATHCDKDFCSFADKDPGESPKEICFLQVDFPNSEFGNWHLVEKNTISGSSRNSCQETLQNIKSTIQYDPI